jgi:tripartite-type tricarboxylate transporter receptor subunit TctC
MRSLLVAIGFALCGATGAAAQTYPAKPVRVVVPYPAGGVVDGLMRSVGQQFTETVGQPLIIDNKPGANTIIALEACAKSPPDGYTLCTSSADGMSFNPHLYKTLPYDPDHDFAPITQMVWVNGAIIAGAKVPYNTVAEMISVAKVKPGTINFASFGLGSTPQFYLEWFNKRARAEMVHVVYKGMAQILPALLSGEVDVTFTAMGIVLPQIAAGEMKALAVTNPERSPYLPNVSTLAEQGLDPKLRNWFGLFAPARTPQSILDRLSQEFVKALRSQRFQEQFLEAQAFDAVGNTPAEFGAFLKQDRANAQQVVAVTGIRLDDDGKSR